MCSFCNGERTLYQTTIDTKIYINTLGKATALEVVARVCPPYCNCSMRDIPLRSAFIIKYCPECGRKLSE